MHDAELSGSGTRPASCCSFQYLTSRPSLSPSLSLSAQSLKHLYSLPPEGTPLTLKHHPLPKAPTTGPHRPVPQPQHNRVGSVCSYISDLSFDMELDSQRQRRGRCHPNTPPLAGKSTSSSLLCMGNDPGPYRTTSLPNMSSATSASAGPGAGTKGSAVQCPIDCKPPPALIPDGPPSKGPVPAAKISLGSAGESKGRAGQAHKGPPAGSLPHSRRGGHGHGHGHGGDCCSGGDGGGGGSGGGSGGGGGRSRTDPAAAVDWPPFERLFGACPRGVPRAPAAVSPAPNGPAPAPALFGVLPFLPLSDRWCLSLVSSVCRAVVAAWPPGPPRSSSRPGARGSSLEVILDVDGMGAPLGPAQRPPAPAVHPRPAHMEHVRTGCRGPQDGARASSAGGRGGGLRPSANGRFECGGNGDGDPAPPARRSYRPWDRLLLRAQPCAPTRGSEAPPPPPALFAVLAFLPPPARQSLSLASSACHALVAASLRPPAPRGLPSSGSWDAPVACSPQASCGAGSAPDSLCLISRSPSTPGHCPRASGGPGPFGGRPRELVIETGLGGSPDPRLKHHRIHTASDLDDALAMMTDLSEPTVMRRAKNKKKREKMKRKLQVLEGVGEWGRG